MINRIIKKIIQKIARESARSTYHYKSKAARLIAEEIAIEESRNLKRGLEKRALEQTMDYIENNLVSVPALRSKWHVMEAAIEAQISQGDVMEFGVAAGESINFIAKRVDQKVYGFDSFEGLTENWGLDHGKGTFKQNKLPHVEKNVELVKGFFDPTLEQFMENNTSIEPSLLHIDCDLYSSTAYVLDKMKPKIHPGLIIVFDEYFNFPAWQKHEFKAWQEFREKNHIKYEYLAYSERGRQVAIKIV